MMPLPRFGRTGTVVAIYAALGLAWVALSRGVVPSVIAAAFAGRSLPVLNRFVQAHTGGHPVGHYFALWDAFAGAALLAGALHLGIELAVGRLARRNEAAGPGERGGIGGGTARLFVGFALAFLGVTLLSGPRHDYVADLEIWDVIRRGEDPWWLREVGQIPLNAYGPLFNAMAPVAWVNPMAPKLLFATAYLGFLIWLVEGAGAGKGLVGLPRFGLVAWFLNPFPWVEIAWFGHFDILVAVACVAAVDARIRGRDGAAGASLAGGILLKYLPGVVLPFLAMDGRRFRPRVVLSAAVPVALGLGQSVLIWGPATFRPLRFAASRGSNLLSIFRFLRGEYSPLRLVWEHPDVDVVALPCLAVAGGAVFAWCWWRRADVATSALLAVLTTLLFYRVGFVQYQMVPFVLASYWAVRPGRPAGRDGFLAAALGIYFGWLAIFDVYYASFGGVVHPGDPWAWVDDVVGLPMFLAGCLLIAGLIRNASRAGQGETCRRDEGSRGD